MAESEFSKYVVAEVGNLGIDLQRLQDEQNIFAEEAFGFLSHNAHLWVEYPKHFLFIHAYPSICRFFTPNIGKAVVAQAYINRVKCRKIFIEKQNELNTIEGYERFITEFAVLKDSLYFYNFLIWISTIFELTMFCYKRGYDYIACGKQCLARYPDILHFYIEGGWTTLDDSVSLISSIIDQISLAHLKRTWFDEQTLVFIKYRTALERRHRYESNSWTKLVHGDINANNVKQKVSAKFRAASALNHLQIIPGYKIKFKNSSSEQCKDAKRDDLIQNEKPFDVQAVGSGNQQSASKTTRKIRKLEISDVGSESFSFCVEYNTPKRDKFSCSSEGEKNSSIVYFDELNERWSFIISERYLKRKDIPIEYQKYGCGIKICSSRGDYFVNYLNEVINENINRKNYHKIDEKVLAVCQPVCDFEGSQIPVVVLDTSSEEEDDEEIDIPQLQFRFDQFLETQERERSRLFKSPEELQLENVYVSTEIPEQRSCSARNTGAILNIMSATDNHRNNLQATYRVCGSSNIQENLSQNIGKLSEDYCVQQQLERCTDEIIRDEHTKRQLNNSVEQITPKSSTGNTPKTKNSDQNNLKSIHPCNTQNEEDLILSLKRKSEEDCSPQQSESGPEESTANESIESESRATSVGRNKKSLTKKHRSVSKSLRLRRRMK